MRNEASDTSDALAKRQQTDENRPTLRRTAQQRNQQAHNNGSRYLSPLPISPPPTQSQTNPPPPTEKGKNLLDKILHPAKHKEEKARRASAGAAEAETHKNPTTEAAAEQHVETGPTEHAVGDHAKHSESEVKKFEE
ncbi:hypothetical protein Q7P37_001463 [Cladosporium fusiforme]